MSPAALFTLTILGKNIAQNCGESSRTNIGVNYFSTIDKAANDGDKNAQEIKSGIQCILTKKLTVSS
jgi:hypothetical protein